MAQSKHWIKLYTEILDDPKMAMLSNHLWRRAVEVFLLAGKAGEDGKLWPVSQMAFVLRLPEKQLIEDLTALRQVGMVNEPEPGQWVVVNFAKRQAPSDAALRVQRWRDKQRNSNSNSNVSGNTPETETETETDKSQSRAERYDDSLSLAFEDETGIAKDMNGGAEKWLEAEVAMLAAGVEPGDVRTAVRELQAKKKYAIVGLQSVRQAAIMAKGRRQGRESAGGRVLTGPNGETMTL